MSKIIEKILAHPNVESISDEREFERRPPGEDENGDGFWVYMEPGFRDGLEHLHSFHEHSPSECLKLLKRIEKCPADCECFD